MYQRMKTRRRGYGYEGGIHSVVSVVSERNW
jgi:hypothetical protein